MKNNIKQSNIDDQYIIDLCITPEGGISHGKPGQIERKPEYKAVKEYLIHRYNDIPEEQFTFNEAIFRIYHHIEMRPVCKVCGKPVKFYKPVLDPSKHKVYRDTCSEECRSKVALSTCQETNMQRYGVKSNLQFKETQEKSHIASQSTKAKEKKKQSMISRYNREHAFDTTESRAKARKYSAEYRSTLKKNSDYMKAILSENPNTTIDDYKNKSEFQVYVDAYLKTKETSDKISNALRKNNPNKEYIKKEKKYDITDIHVSDDIFN